MDTRDTRTPRYSRRTKKNQALLRLIGPNECPEFESDTGYKSGRSSWRGTPDSASIASTRSAGTTPRRDHLLTASYEMPHFLAKADRPPPASMARSTAFMGGILQPIVANGQQPELAGHRVSLQLMVVRSKEEAREEFSRNLNRELDRLQAPRRGRPDWLRKQLGNAVSRESCRKWLAGKDLPDQTNLSILIDRLQLNEQYLRTGAWGPAPGSKDQRFVELEKAWPGLNDEARDAIIGILRAMQPSAVQPSSAARRRKT